MTKSFRTFLWNIKTVTDDAELFTNIKAYDPSITIKASCVRALQELVIKTIPDLNEKTCIEMLGILNTLVPGVASDSTVQNVYVHVRKSLKAKYGETSDVVKKSYSLMQFDQVKWKANREAYNEKVVAKNRDKVQFSQEKVLSVMDFIKAKQAPDFIDLAVG